MRQSNQGLTPSLGETIQTMIDSALVDVRICMPAKVVKYYPDTQYADVQIQLKTKYESGALLALPVIPNVPVKHQRAFGGKARIHMPLKAGDDLTLVICDRSLDNWKTQGGMTDPQDRRKHNISDAFALIGGSSEPDAFDVDDPDAIEIVNDQGMLQVLKGGKFKLKGVTDELVDLVSQLADACSNILTSTMLGPQPPINKAAFTALKAKFDALKG